MRNNKNSRRVWGASSWFFFTFLWRSEDWWVNVYTLRMKQLWSADDALCCMALCLNYVSYHQRVWGPVFFSLRRVHWPVRSRGPGRCHRNKAEWGGQGWWASRINQKRKNGALALLIFFFLVFFKPAPQQLLLANSKSENNVSVACPIFFLVIQVSKDN